MTENRQKWQILADAEKQKQAVLASLQNNNGEKKDNHSEAKSESSEKK